MHDFVKDLHESELYNDAGNNLFDRFVMFLHEIRSIFTEKRRIKNMIRDVERAIYERGSTFLMVQEQIDLLFEDIRSDLVGLVFFRAMTGFHDPTKEEAEEELRKKKEKEDENLARLDRTFSDIQVDVGDEKVEKVELWTIRTFLKTIELLQDVARSKLLEQNRFLLVNVEELFAMMVEFHRYTHTY